MNYFLQTRRLGFRHWEAGDLPLAVALWTDPEVMGHMGGAMSPEAAASRLWLEIDRQAQLGFQYWPTFALQDEQHVGCAGLQPFHEQSDVLEVGVHTARQFWSGRFGEEAAHAVFEYAWHHTSASTLVAGHGPNNVHSAALVQRLGFHYTHHEPWGPHGTLHPYYRLERPL